MFQKYDMSHRYELLRLAVPQVKHYLEKMLTSSGWYAGSLEEDSIYLDLCTPEELASLYSCWVCSALVVSSVWKCVLFIAVIAYMINYTAVIDLFQTFHNNTFSNACCLDNHVLPFSVLVGFWFRSTLWHMMHISELSFAWTGGDTVLSRFFGTIVMST